MKTLKCAVLGLAVAGFAVIVAGCATSAQPQPIVSAKEPIAAAVTNDSQFVARLVAGSPWQGRWEAFFPWGTKKGTFELLFRMEDGKLKASTQKVTNCTCKEGESEILEISSGNLKLRTASGAAYDFKIDEDGNLSGQGVSGDKFPLSSSATPSTK